jgi:hypothetical protein
MWKMNKIMSSLHKGGRKTVSEPLLRHSREGRQVLPGSLMTSTQHNSPGQPEDDEPADLFISLPGYRYKTSFWAPFRAF